MPRTGTTMLMHGLASQLAIPNLGEALRFNNPNADQKSTAQWIDGRDSGVIKILSDHVSHANLDDIIQRARFSEIYVTNRCNLTDCCVSHYFTMFYGYHFKQKPTLQSPREVPKEHVNHWLFYMYQPFQQTMKRWRAYEWTWPMHYYEDLISTKSVKVAGQPTDLAGTKQEFVASELDYRQLCVNYSDVENYIQRNLDPC